MVAEERSDLIDEEIERYNSRYDDGGSGRSIGGTLQSDAWSTIQQHEEDEFVGLLEAHVSDGDRILDYAGGYGNATRHFLRRNSEVDAEHVVLDVSIAELRRGREEDHGERLEPVLGDGHRLPFDDDAFDAVAARNAFHHLPDWHRAGLEEVGRVLGPGGVLVFKDPLRYNPFAWAFRQLCETREKTDAEVPLDPTRLRARLERVFADVRLHGNYLVSPGIAMLDRHLPVSTAPLAKHAYGAERWLFERGAFPLAGTVVGIAWTD